MKTFIPWWFKILAKIFLSRVPVNYSFWQRLGLFRHGSMDQASYVINVFNNHVNMAGLSGKLKGKTLLEIGPGDSVSTAIVAACYGARSILIDAGPYAATDIARYHKLVEVLSRSGLYPPDISLATTIDEILVICDARYLTQGLESFSFIETETVDFIFSQAVLEHVRKHEFLNTIHECFRVLKLKGVASHRIDLKDHLGGSLNNLRFNESIWESDFFVNSGFYTNRIRFPEMIALFKETEWSVDVGKITSWESLPMNRLSLSNDFSFLSDDDLLVSCFDVLLRKNK